MKLLLDTHILLWAAGQPEKLSTAALALIVFVKRGRYPFPLELKGCVPFSLACRGRRQQTRTAIVNPIVNYNSVLEIVFALNAMTYLFSIEPRRRGELLGLFLEFRKRVPDFDRTDRQMIRGYVILAHYGAAHLTVTLLSLLFAVLAVGLMLYGAAVPGASVPTQWMVPGAVAMLTLVPFGSVWLTFVCRTQFEKYIAGFSTEL